MDGKRVRVAAETTNMDKAHRHMRRIEDGEEPIAPKPAATVTEAAAKFFEHRARELDAKTKRKYKNTLGHLERFAAERKLTALGDVGIAHLDDYGSERRRTLSALSWSKELQRLRAFFAWCIKREYTATNPAKEVEMPHDPKPAKEIVPYTKQEIIAILAACDTFGRRPYERLRAKAMVLVMRHTALAISDTIMLSRAQVQNGGQIRLNRIKTGKAISVWVPSVVTDALGNVPQPIGSPNGGSGYFFWNAVMSERALIGVAERTMAAVFSESGVKDAGTHRFRHTLATRMLEDGATFEDVAAILGNSAKVVERHYAKWSRAREERLNSILARISSDTNLTQGTIPGDKSFPFNGGKWCGEGDLNPHEITPASTSS